MNNSNKAKFVYKFASAIYIMMIFMAVSGFVDMIVSLFTGFHFMVSPMSVAQFIIAVVNAIVFGTIAMIMRFSINEDKENK